VRLKVSVFVPLADKLFLSLNLPKHRALEVQVTPAWISEDASTGTFDLGARFLEMSDETKVAIQDFQMQALAS
jgi:hypothetical protein